MFPGLSNEHLLKDMNISSDSELSINKESKECESEEDEDEDEYDEEDDNNEEYDSEDEWLQLVANTFLNLSLIHI